MVQTRIPLRPEGFRSSFEFCVHVTFPLQHAVDPEPQFMSS